jgi:hypothetical protein
VQDKKAAGRHFSKTCCPNTTRVSTVKTMQNDAKLEAIIAEMERLAAFISQRDLRSKWCRHPGLPSPDEVIE